MTLALAGAVLSIGERMLHGEHAPVPVDADTQRPEGDPEVGGV
jgi:hypothetical protein